MVFAEDESSNLSTSKTVKARSFDLAFFHLSFEYFKKVEVW